MKHKDEIKRGQYLKYANGLADFCTTTSEKCPITYDMVVAVEELLDLIREDYGFEYKKIKNSNGVYFQSSYNGLIFEEDNPDD